LQSEKSLLGQDGFTVRQNKWGINLHKLIVLSTLSLQSLAYIKSIFSGAKM